MVDIYYFRGFTDNQKRRNFIGFMQELKNRMIKVEKPNKDEEYFSVGNESIYGNNDSSDCNKYDLFPSKEMPMDLVKKYAVRTSYNWKLVFSIMTSFLVIIGLIMLFSFFNWQINSQIISGTVDNTIQNCYISRGFFSANQNVCETAKFKVNGIWYKNQGSSTYKIGDYINVKCLKEKCE